MYFLKQVIKEKNYIFYSRNWIIMSYLLEMLAQPSYMIGQSQTSVCACTSTSEQMQESEWAVVGI